MGYRSRMTERPGAAFGAELEVIDSPDGIHPGLIPAMQARAAEIVATDGGTRDGGYANDQFHKRDALIKRCGWEQTK